MGVWQYDTTPANNTTAADDINWATGVTPSEVDNNARRAMADVAELLLDQACTITTSGSAGALTASTNGTIPSLADGLRIGLIAHTNVSAAATLNVDSEGAKPLYVNGSAIAAGHLPSGQHFDVTYDASVASGAWIVHNATQLNDGSVDTAQLVDDCVTAAKIDDGAVGAAAIAAGSVTNAKMDNMPQYRVKGRVSAGDGSPQNLTADNLLTVIAQATGDCTLQGAMDITGTITGSGNFVHDSYNPSVIGGEGVQVASAGRVQVQRPSTATSSDKLFVGTKGNTEVFNVRATGDVYGSGTYGTISDVRYKRDVVEMPNYLGALLKIPLIRYRLRDEVASMGDDAPIRIGTIAQNLQKTPISFAVTKDPDSGRLSVDITSIVYLGIQAIQMLDKRVRKLEALSK